ncbi:MAG: serine/threonine-protein kinase [Polyangiaceae bacterium]
MVAAPGEVIAERFRLDQEIGRGERGVLFRATDLATGIGRAVKALDPSVAQGEDEARRIQVDSALLIDTGATSFLPVLECLTDARGSVFVVTELLEAEPLDRHLGDIEEFGERIRLAAALELLGPVAETLGRAHGHGLVHGAVKPSNVLLVDPDSGGGVRLSDFFIARPPTIDVTTDPRVVLGSTAYLAPEVLAGARPDARSDQYAFASVLFRLLAGHPPFPARSTLELFALATQGPRPTITASRTELHPAIDRWAAEALSVDPRRRYPTLPAMWRDFVGALLKTQNAGLARFRP